MDIVNEIKSRISMRQITEKYNLQIERGGYIACPFHEERTPSLKIYDQPGKGFCCFGCGAAGSVIDFVMLLHKIGFRQAVVRIASDFGIISISNRAGIKERRRWQIEQIKKQKLTAIKKERINTLTAEHCRHWLAYKKESPWSDKWCQALIAMPKIDYELEELMCTQKTTT
jgi:DNA primase